MKQQIRNNGNERFTFKACDIKRSYLLIHTIGDAVNVAPADTDIDLTKIRASLTLKQGNGKPLTSSFNAVGPTVCGAMKDKSGSVQDLGFASGGTTCKGINIVAEGVATKQESYLVIPLLDTAIVLQGDDEFNVDIDLLSGHFGTAVDADSKVYLVTEDGTDLNQLDVELPMYFPLTADKQSVQYNFDAVSEVALLDSGTSASKTACAFSSIEINSKHYNERFDTVQLFALNQMDQLGIPSERLLNFPILNVNPHALYDVKINASVDTTLITTNNQWLYVKQVQFNNAVARRSFQKRDLSLHRKAIRRGLVKM